MAEAKSAEATPEKAELPAAVQEPPPAPPADYVADIAALKAQLEVVTNRLAQLEQVGHSDHAPEAGALESITAHVLAHVHEYMQKALGHSGLPSA